MKVLRQPYLYAALVAALFGCGTPHGQPHPGAEVPAPSEVLEFGALYSENCAGCHGESGRGGAAITLADPVYLAIADDGAIRKAVAKGVHGTAMPAFAESAGGLLTDKQIDLITQGMRSGWSEPGILNGANPPSYAAKSGRLPARRNHVQNVLRILSRPRWPRREKGQRDHERFLPRVVGCDLFVG